MARKTISSCDKCGREVDEGKGATMRLILYRRTPRGKGSCRPLRPAWSRPACPGDATARRGRKPKDSLAHRVQTPARRSVDTDRPRALSAPLRFPHVPRIAAGA